MKSQDDKNIARLRKDMLWTAARGAGQALGAIALGVVMLNHVNDADVAVAGMSGLGMSILVVSAADNIADASALRRIINNYMKLQNREKAR